jgi:signal transduction histidine kinase
MRIEMRRDGDLDRLPPLVELASFRIVQEALTNVIKHAAGSSVTVTIHGEPDEVTVEVKDNGVGSRRVAAAEKGAGRGLAGMQERVALLGGTLEYGPLPFGGFRVLATLPTKEASQ